MDDLSNVLSLGDAQNPPPERMLQILTAAARLFATQGYDGTSMRDIAQECGISKATLYHYFPDKDSIIRPMAMGMTKSIYMHVAGTDDSTRPPLERLRTFMVETATFFEKFRWAWIAGSTIFWNDPQVRRRKQRLEWRDRYEGLLREIIREGIRRGDIQEVDVALAGRLVVSTLNWLPRWYNVNGPLTAPEIADQFYRMIASGFATREG
jgi:AcrR family transcriptional regulator